MQDMLNRPNLIKLGAAVVLIVIALAIRNASVPSVTIHDAAWDGNLQAVRGQLRHGTDVNERDENGSTALHSAAVWGHTEIVRLLLEKGADVNATDGAGCTPLDWALDTSKQDTVVLLRQHGGQQRRRPPH